MKKNHLLSLLAGLSLCAASCGGPTAETDAVIPRPASVEKRSGACRLASPLALSFDAPAEVADALTAYLRTTPLAVRTDDPQASDGYLRLTVAASPELPASEEGYVLSVLPEGVSVASRGEAGLFYGIQTLLQLQEQFGDRIPAQRITDSPRFSYRGMHLDEARHFFGKEFVKKQLRMMASLKLNRFHWHLTDGAGWRIEIDRYPELTELAAWRPIEGWQPWLDAGRPYCRRDDPNAYGGFYTKDDIREVVAYADSLHITVIPEIEMPGHSEEVLAVYPHLSCAGKPHVYDDFCIGNDATFEFLENVLEEVMELFPSEYIHVGGDEATKKGWPTCPKCRARMQREGLKDVDELQSYAVHRLEAFLNARGRRLLGWDEILQGGLAPNAAVMSWRGESGGREAAASGHPVVMVPGSYCYLDKYQGNPSTEPEALEGSVPLPKTYMYEPAPQDMPGRERVLGVQANLWTERIATPEYAEYMLYPRVFAVAEIAWSAPELKDYEDFRRRALMRIDAVRAKGYNTFDLAGSVRGERPESLEEVRHLAVGCPVTYASEWYEGYPADGPGSLTDGKLGSWTYGYRWLGFLNTDVEATVDLGAVKPIREVKADFLRWRSAFIGLPKRVEIAVSTDGERFTVLGGEENDLPFDDPKLQCRAFGWTGEAEARYVRCHAFSHGHPGGWLFIDEIIVN